MTFNRYVSIVLFVCQIMMAKAFTDVYDAQQSQARFNKADCSGGVQGPPVLPEQNRILSFEGEQITPGIVQYVFIKQALLINETDVSQHIYRTPGAKKPNDQSGGASNSFFTLPFGQQRRSVSTGDFSSSAGFCSTTPGSVMHRPSFSFRSVAQENIKLPIPSYQPVEGALKVDPDLAQQKLGDDLYGEPPLQEFFRQTLPGVDTSQFVSLSERNALASHYRTTYGQMKPIHKKNGKKVHRGIGNKGSIGENMDDLRRMKASSLSLTDHGAGAIGNNIEDSNMFAFMTSTRRFLGRHEDDRHFQIDFRRVDTLHDRYSLSSGADREAIARMEDTFTDLKKVFHNVVRQNQQFNINVDWLDQSEFFIEDENGAVTVYAIPPQWIPLVIQVLLYDYYQSFDSITNERQMLEKMAGFGAMFMFIRPFQECNELTLINLFKMTLDLFSSNTSQLQLDSLVFDNKSLVSRLSFPGMLQALYNARRMDGYVVHVSSPSLDAEVTNYYDKKEGYEETQEITLQFYPDFEDIEEEEPGNPDDSEGKKNNIGDNGLPKLKRVDTDEHRKDQLI